MIFRILYLCCFLEIRGSFKVEEVMRNSHYPRAQTRIHIQDKYQYFFKRWMNVINS